MTDKYTPEPWFVTADHTISSQLEGIELAYVELMKIPHGRENARRIAACVNACRGVSTSALDANYISRLERALVAYSPWTNVDDSLKGAGVWTAELEGAR